MEKRSHLRKGLGLTQERMAMLLGISRAHYAMYETGRRTIPLRAEQILTQLTLGANSKSSVKQVSTSKNDRVGERKLLEELLAENKYQSLKTQRAMDGLLARETVAVKRAALKETLQKAFGDKEFKRGGIMSAIAREPKRPDVADSASLLRLEIRLEVLELEKSVLKNRLKNFE